MKFLKVLTVPAVLLFSVVMAAPAFAHKATITSLTASCDQTGKVCVDFKVTTTDFDDNGRDILLNLLGRKPNTSDFIDTGVTPVRVHLKKELENSPIHVCFPGAPPTGFDQFEVKVTVPPDVLDANGNPIKDVKNDDLDLGTPGNTLTSPPFSASTCVVQTSPSPPTPTPPTPTPTATPAAAALASTGGFDFRFPLVGLTVLVGGLALLLVSVSRGRSPSK